jgi:glyoxylase-like metal-dependent hydrolase (beta-lactamase superfamily II)
METKILHHLWQVGGEDLTAPGDAAIYLIRFGDQAALIDAGCGRAHARLTANIDRCLGGQARLTRLLLTHCHFDHCGGADAVRRTYGCSIVAHALDAVFLEAGDSDVTAASWYGAKMDPLPVDIKLDLPETRLPVGSGTITARHWPGHSPGSMIYFTRVDDRLVLFGQDVHGPIHPSLKSDARCYQASLRQILQLDADLLLEGHFGIIEGKAAVRRFIRSYMNPDVA